MEKFGPCFVGILGLHVITGMEGEGSNEEEEQELKGCRYPVCDEVVNPLKDLSGVDDAMNNCAQTFLSKDNVSSGSRSICCTSNRNTTISTFQCGCIVYPEKVMRGVGK